MTPELLELVVTCALEAVLGYTATRVAKTWVKYAANELTKAAKQSAVKTAIKSAVKSWLKFLMYRWSAAITSCRLMSRLMMKFSLVKMPKPAMARIFGDVCQPQPRHPATEGLNGRLDARALRGRRWVFRTVGHTASLPAPARSCPAALPKHHR